MRITVQKKPHRGHAVGTEIEVSRQTARVLVAVGLASPAVAPEPEPVPEPEVPEETARRKRTYRRRDMQAE